MIDKESKMETFVFNGDYLDLQDLPHNCIFNKVRCGCGGTTIALRNGENYVIAVPYTELIINKLGRSDAGVAECTFVDGEQKVTRSIFGLFGSLGDCKEELEKYVKSDGVKKILCTYDKMQHLDQFITLAEYRLLIDEYQQLLMAYSYRQHTIDVVLDTFRKFKSFCFMSATPIQPDFKPDCMADVPEVRATWTKMEKLQVLLVPNDKPYMLAANVINHYKINGYMKLDGKKSEEAYFFINSVTDIKKILSHCKLSADEVKIICADNDVNRQKLQGYKIEDSSTPPKKFTFLTSKSFEGADYFSPTGVAFVVSSGRSPNTMLGVDTDIPQIAGRIRDTCFRNVVVHFVSPNVRLHYLLPYAKFKKKQEADIKGAYELVSCLNSMSEEGKAVARNGLNDNKCYIQFDKANCIYTFNDRIPKLEMYKYQICQDMYKNTYLLTKYYKSIGANIKKYASAIFAKDLKNACQTPTFKEVYLKYSEFKQKCPHLGIVPDEIRLLMELQPLVKDAYQKLGDETVRNLRYSKSKISDALDSIDETKNQDNIIASILQRKIQRAFVSSEELKKILTEAYAVAGKNKVATASDIGRWYETNEKTIRIKGKPTRGHVILKPKYVFDGSIAY